ncbi:formylglycine-generating enzyme family protein [Faunimonas sp. B44]|uniref:formylglycine-generating enzyme family protein n=1 Tax=Faunimonas sp. B44 TaxID=3461493 RepID=UPI004044C00F
MRILTRFLPAALVSAGLLTMIQGFAPPPGDKDLVTIGKAAVTYREPGEFLLGGAPQNGPLAEIAAERPFRIMKRQVTRGEYDSCVAARACKPLDRPGKPDLPVVGVSYVDATAYAGWLSGQTGYRYRLPTDREWALAAGSRYKDDAYTEVSDPANPSRRWIAVYEAESGAQEAIDPEPQPVGTFGANENGLLDLSGNVWEWTSTCFVRHQSDPAAGRETKHENCGVRIAEGRHRAYMITFFRDPKAGACSVGIPPANLGMRLVRDDRGFLEGVQDYLGF